MQKITSPTIIISEDELHRMIASAAHQAAEEVAKRIQPASLLRPPHVTQTQAAEMVGVSRATISNMVRFGTFRLNEFGMIPIEQIDQAIKAKAA